MALPGLKGKTVLVTGGSRGIGLAVARGFASEGVQLHILGTDAKVTKAAIDIGATGHIADITLATDVARVMAAIGRLDVLVNNAGLERVTPLDDPSVENEATFRRIVEINVVGTFLITRAALPQLSAGGSIINTASVWSRGSEGRFAAYVASKHATIGLTKTWAKELGPRGIRVNAICPGWVKTDASMLSLRRMSETTGRTEADMLDDILKGQILPGLMQPDDIAGPYLFLASDLAANITGQSLGIDRGEFPW